MHQEAVGENQPAKWTKKETLPEITKSFHNYMVKDVLQDYAANVLQVIDNPDDFVSTENMPSQQYEFPHGYNSDFGAERYSIPEGLFDPSNIKVLFV